MLAAAAQLERFAKEKLSAERLRIPDPVVRVGLKRGEGFPDTRTGSVIAVTVPIPLFNRGQAEVTRAEAEHEKASARLDALERQIQAEVRAAHVAFELRRALFDQYRLGTEKSSRELVRIARIAYEEGEKSILELLDVYRASRQAELRGLAPILMTALAAGLALIPVALGMGKPGSEIQAPMAIVILFGLLSSTALNMIVVPAAVARFGGRALR